MNTVSRSGTKMPWLGCTYDAKKRDEGRGVAIRHGGWECLEGRRDAWKKRAVGRSRPLSIKCAS